MSRAWVWVAVGSVGGALCRWLLTQHLPGVWPTLLANVSGALLLGVFIGLPAFKSPEARWLLATGFCGSYTTFSTFSIETLLMLKEGMFLKAIAYSLGSLLLGLAAAASGFYLSQRLG